MRGFANLFLACVVCSHVAAKPLRGLTAPKPLGWSAPGHEITGAVAAALLGPKATAMVANILGSGNSLESVGPWADTMRSNPDFSSWSPPLHFINTPDWQCAFTPDTDCPNSICLMGAILNYTARASKLTGVQQWQALAFLVHFMGDIHQPMHVSFASNYGGNTITGTLLGVSTNDHHMWDYNIPAQRITADFNNDQAAYITYLVDQIQGPWASNATEWASCVTPGSGQCIVEWASETAALACTYGYKDQTGAIIQTGYDLGMPYYEFAIPIVEMQLAKGGVRLAGILNNMWSGLTDEELASAGKIIAAM